MVIVKVFIFIVQLICYLGSFSQTLFAPCKTICTTQDNLHPSLYFYFSKSFSKVRGRAQRCFAPSFNLYDIHLRLCRYFKAQSKGFIWFLCATLIFFVIELASLENCMLYVLSLHLSFKSKELAFLVKNVFYILDHVGPDLEVTQTQTLILQQSLYKVSLLQLFPTIHILYATITQQSTCICLRGFYTSKKQRWKMLFLGPFCKKNKTICLLSNGLVKCFF